MAWAKGQYPRTPSHLRRLLGGSGRCRFLCGRGSGGRRREGLGSGLSAWSLLVFDLQQLPIVVRPLGRPFLIGYLGLADPQHVLEPVLVVKPLDDPVETFAVNDQTFLGRKAGAQGCLWSYMYFDDLSPFFFPFSRPFLSLAGQQDEHKGGGCQDAQQDSHGSPRCCMNCPTLSYRLERPGSENSAGLSRWVDSGQATGTGGQTIPGAIR